MNFVTTTALALTATTPTIDLGTIDVNPMLDIIVKFIPIGIPIMLVLLGIRMGLGIFKSMTRGA